MGLFSFKPKAGTNEKNKVNGELKHLDSVLKKLNTTDSIDAYFSNFEEMLRTYGRLQKLEEGYNWHGLWKGGVSKALKGIEDKRPAAERAFVDRAYERLQRDCLKVKTQKAKDSKREQFFAELEHYNKYLTNETIKYIESIK